MSSFFAKGGSRLTSHPPVQPWGATTAKFSKSTGTLRRSRNTTERKTHIPGYTGFIKHSAEVAGRPYARATARALNNPAGKLAVGDMIPSEPQATRKIPMCGDLKKSTTLVGKYQQKVRHVPGYTGHVADTRHRIGETYGRTTGAVLKRPIIAKEDRKAMNRASLKRVSGLE